VGRANGGGLEEERDKGEGLKGGGFEGGRIEEIGGVLRYQADLASSATE